MNRFLLTLTALSLFSVGARADESTVRQLVEARFTAKVDGVQKTGYGGLYEVRLGDTLVYTDEKVNFLMVGNLIDAKTRENITEARKEKLSQVKFDDLPLDAAIKVVRGNGKNVFAVFADPNCGFCKRFERDLATLSDVTMYTFLYPILDSGNGGDSMRKSKAIWCSKDRGKAWMDLMLKNTAPIMAGNCDTAVLQRNLELGQKLGINGTPTSFAANGQRVIGARFPELRKAIEVAKN
ncbi:MAG: DsbC family protein [Burkholderiales bacterium]